MSWSELMTSCLTCHFDGKLNISVLEEKKQNFKNPIPSLRIRDRERDWCFCCAFPAVWFGFGHSLTCEAWTENVSHRAIMSNSPPPNFSHLLFQSHPAGPAPVLFHCLSTNRKQDFVLCSVEPWCDPVELLLLEFVFCRLITMRNDCFGLIRCRIHEKCELNTLRGTHRSKFWHFQWILAFLWILT